MTEQVSALMDDQLDGAECEGCLRRLKDDESMRADWEVYHLIGDALRGTPARGLPATFAARLAAEPTILAPRASASRSMSPRRKAWYALSAAASVAAVAAVGWMAVNVVQPPAPPIAMVQPPVQAQPAAAPAQATVIPVAQGVGDYVLAHQRYSPRSAMAGVMPYVGSMADDAGKR